MWISSCNQLSDIDPGMVLKRKGTCQRAGSSDAALYRFVMVIQPFVFRANHFELSQPPQRLACATLSQFLVSRTPGGVIQISGRLRGIIYTTCVCSHRHSESRRCFKQVSSFILTIAARRCLRAKRNKLFALQIIQLGGNTWDIIGRQPQLPDACARGGGKNQCPVLVSYYPRGKGCYESKNELERMPLPGVKLVAQLEGICELVCHSPSLGCRRLIWETSIIGTSDIRTQQFSPPYGVLRTSPNFESLGGLLHTDAHTYIRIQVHQLAHRSTANPSAEGPLEYGVLSTDYSVHDSLLSSTDTQWPRLFRPQCEQTRTTTQASPPSPLFFVNPAY